MFIASGYLPKCIGWCGLLHFQDHLKEFCMQGFCRMLVPSSVEQRGGEKRGGEKRRAEERRGSESHLVQPLQDACPIYGNFCRMLIPSIVASPYSAIGWITPPYSAIGWITVSNNLPQIVTGIFMQQNSDFIARSEREREREREVERGEQTEGGRERESVCVCVRERQKDKKTERERLCE